MMTRFNRNALAVGALSMITLLGACDSADRLQGIEKPSYILNEGSSMFQPVTLAVPAGAQTATAEFSSAGGTLRVGKHSLLVPKHAVREATIFTMKVVPGNHVQVELSAVRKRSGLPVFTFSVPLRLTLSYSGTGANGASLSIGHQRSVSSSTSSSLSRTVSAFGTSVESSVTEGLESVTSETDETVSTDITSVGRYILGTD